jgi:hypothetical protein
MTRADMLSWNTGLITNETLLNSVTMEALNNITQKWFHRVILYKHNICWNIQLRKTLFHVGVQHVPACSTLVVVCPTAVKSSTCQPTTQQEALQQLMTKVGLSRPSRAFTAQHRMQCYLSALQYKLCSACYWPTYCPQLQLNSKYIWIKKNHMSRTSHLTHIWL